MDEWEKFTVKIEDDFDLAKIAFCGQCFRVKVFDDGTYRFITGDEIVYIKQSEKKDYYVQCSKNSWEKVWTDYFDLYRNYGNIRKRAAHKNDFVDKALTAGAGLRVLRQDAWEMLVTFIISQRKNIPAISKAVENLSERLGRKIVTACESVYTFPTPEKLCQATERELALCGLGYRTAYVRDAAERVLSGRLDLNALCALKDEELFHALLDVYGVGKKVANCVCLFGYGRMSRVPVDVWISRAIKEECGGQNPFVAYGSEAGIIQQYVFYFIRKFL